MNDRSDEGRPRGHEVTESISRPRLCMKKRNGERKERKVVRTFEIDVLRIGDALRSAFVKRTSNCCASRGNERMTKRTRDELAPRINVGSAKRGFPSSRMLQSGIRRLHIASNAAAFDARSRSELFGERRSNCVARAIASTRNISSKPMRERKREGEEGE